MIGIRTTPWFLRQSCQAKLREKRPADNHPKSQTSQESIDAIDAVGHHTARPIVSKAHPFSRLAIAEKPDFPPFAVLRLRTLPPHRIPV